MCNKSETISKLAEALVKFNLEVKIIEKDATNPHFKNQYASLDTIVDEVRPLLAKHGLVMMQFPGGDGEKFTLRSMLLHESGEWIESEPITMRPVKNDPQGIGSCSTYARRYSLSAMLSLNTGEDDDGHNASHEPVKDPAKAYTSPSQHSQTNTPMNNQTSATSQTEAPRMVSSAQIGKIKVMVKQKSVSDEDYRELLNSLGVESSTELTSSQASKLIAMLEIA